MNPLDKYMLLASLTFFFAAGAVSLVSLYNPGTPKSYMYSPAAIEPQQREPLANARREYSELPKSVLHYPMDTAAPASDKTVTCYLEAEYRKIAADNTAGGAVLAVRAMMDGDTLEIYSHDDGRFSAYVIGPDALGQREACEVARGTEWKLVTP